jgi:hypothetical protein
MRTAYQFPVGYYAQYIAKVVGQLIALIPYKAVQLQRVTMDSCFALALV